MPTFDTPAPIAVTVDLVVGDTKIIANDRADTVVEVRPKDESSKSDVQLADHTRVDYADGKLVVKTSALRGALSIKSGSIDVVIELPTGSTVHGKTSAGSLHAEGLLGECEFRTSTGDISIDHTDTLHLATDSGDITVDRAAGHAEVKGCGVVRIRDLNDGAVVKNQDGSIWIGDTAADVRLSSADGDITVDRAQAGIEARTANGNILIGEVRQGELTIKTDAGDLEVGVREGSAVWLDADAQAGKVHNRLTPANAPGQSDETVKVHARTSLGDIVIRRSASAG